MERRSALLNSPEARAKLVQPPSVGKALLISGGITAVLAAAAGICAYEYSNTSEYVDPVPEAKAWRVANAGLGVDWRLCGLRLYEDENCFSEPVDLKDATVISSSQVPDGFKDVTYSSGSCDRPWQSEAAAPHAFIGYSLPKAVQVKCVETLGFQNVTGCSFSLSCSFLDHCNSVTDCASCCSLTVNTFSLSRMAVEAQDGNSWSTVKTVDVDDEMEQSFSTGPDELEDNSAWIVLLVCTIVLSVFAGISLLIVVPVVLCSIVSSRKQQLVLQNEVVAGKALICDADEQQWRVFVEEQWGPNGAVRKGELGFVSSFILGLFLGVLCMLLLKFRSWLSSTTRGYDAIPWFWCAVIGFAIGIVAAYMMMFAAKCVRHRRYNKLKQEKFPLILGTSSMYFAGLFVSQNVLKSRFVRLPTGSACVFEITYIIKGKNDTVKKITAPVGETVLPEAKVFVARNNGFYKAATQPAQRASTGGDAPNGDIMMVPATDVQVVDS